MGFFDKLFGRREEEQPAPQPEQRRNPQRGSQSPEQMTDEQAVERYRYMLRTAPPDAIEQAHAEAFSRLTPEQRRMALAELSRTVPCVKSALKQGQSLWSVPYRRWGRTICS